MHATQLFIDRPGVPHAWGRLDRKSTFFKLIVKFFLKGVVFMFWHQWRTQKIFMEGEGSLSRVWWSFVFGVRCL